ncbi:MAG: glycosyltransferase [Phycisphaerae bacterium]|nr:glycosyltransferase [Phycisphaerae bacterium]
MAELGDDIEPVEGMGLHVATARLLGVIEGGSKAALDSAIDACVGRLKENWEKLLLEAFGYFAQQQFSSAVELLLRANDEITAESRQAIPAVYSEILIKAQLALPRRKRRSTVIGEEYYRQNIAALREVDAPLADEVALADWPGDLTLIGYWGGLHLFAPAKEVLLVLNAQTGEKFKEQIHRINPIAFGRVQTGQELRYFLENQFVGLHGMTRGHYLFEPDAGKIKALLHMYNLSDVLRSEELLVFGGQSMAERFDRKFETLHYGMPEMTIGDNELVKKHIERFSLFINSLDDKTIVQAYYDTDEFRQRKGQIAAGDIMPRILIYTCRWTTFLKYCAADFEKAFKRLGCKTYFQIEVSDVQAHYLAMDWRILLKFKPDMIFMVSHGRPSVSHLPKEVPVLAFIQDRCGPILALEDMTDHIERHDIFACHAGALHDNLREKNVPAEQLFVLPVPADPEAFYPLERNAPEAAIFSTDVAFVKHGQPHPDIVFEDFLDKNIRNHVDREARKRLEQLFVDLYRRSYHTGINHLCERDMHEFMISEMSGAVSVDFHVISQMVTRFNVIVCSASWRSQFLEALERSGMDVRLYGKDWDKYPQLSRLSPGPAGHKKELNCVYNFSRISLHINHVNTMHPRIAECGLAGGFIMAADIPENKDWESARNYYQPDKELVFFDGPDDMVEKCRYYLAHRQERQAIAENLHKRVLAEQTIDIAAGTMLDKWKQLLVKP